MICPNCGAQVADNADFCLTCGAKLNAPAPSAPIQASQVANIIVTIGSQAKAAVSAGRTDEAATHAKNAKLMFILGLVMIGVSLLLTIVIGALYGTLIAAVMEELDF